MATNSRLTRLDGHQVLKAAYDDNTQTLLTADGFFFGDDNVGRRIEVAYPSAAVETYSYYQSATLLYVITVTYTDATKANLLTVERTA